MIRLTKALQAWGTAEFNGVLKNTIETLDTRHLPLQQGLSISSHVVDAPPTAIILKVEDDEGFVHAKVGIMYAGIIAGCSCTDDPTPMSENAEYCIVQFDIDKNTAATTVTLLSE